MTKNNFTRVFEKARSENRAALFIFVTGYHPNYETSKLIIKEILKSHLMQLLNRLVNLIKIFGLEPMDQYID